MSVLIRGMEMPKRCIDCPFMVSRDNDDCVLQTEVENELARTWEELKASCPLVEIPTPHGRLIAEKTITGIRYHDADGYHIVNGEQLCELEIDADTVIEAEGET